MKQKQKRYEMCFTGSGGQGVILCSTILAEAAFLAGKMVAQSQSYGPQARGGLCRAELIIDEERIIYPKVTSAGFLLALTQASLDRLRIGMADDALIIIDSSMHEPDDPGSCSVAALPILQTASETVGKIMTANIVAVGAVNALLGIAPDDLLEQAVLMRVPRGTEQVNLLALNEGRKMGAAAHSMIYP